MHVEDCRYWHLRRFSSVWRTDQGNYGLTQILENIAERYLQNKLTAPSAKELYFKCVLLYLANDDVVGGSQALKKYLNNDPTL